MLRQFLLFILFLFLAGSGYGQVIPYVSVETTSTVTASALDDAWRNDILAGGGVIAQGEGLPAGSYPNGVNWSVIAGVGVRVTALNMNGGSLFGGTPISGNISSSSSTTLQAGAPKPNTSGIPSGTFRNHFNELIGSSSSRNALLFEFRDTSFTTVQPVSSFGAWFGDVEGRSDVTNATVFLFDPTGSLLSSFPVGSNSSVLPAVGSESNCSNTRAGCGNETTRWIGFRDLSAQTAFMLIVVGDEDPLSGSLGTGDEEHLSFVGATIGYRNAQVDILKSCVIPGKTACQTIAPGEVVTYNIAFENTGGRDASNIVITDPMPPYLQFQLGSAQATTNDPTLSFLVEYSSNYDEANPATATWSYLPVSGGGGAAPGFDANVRAIRWVLQAGSLSSSAPSDSGFVSFSARLP